MIPLSAYSPEKIEQWVISEYDFHPYKIEKEGKVKKIACQRGLFAVKKIQHSYKKRLFLQQMYAYLDQQSFTAYVPPFPNKYGDEMVEVDHHLFYVTRWFQDKVEEKYRPTWEKEVLAKMGHLHQVTESFPHTKLVPTLQPVWLINQWYKRLEQMRAYKELAQGRHLMSPVEIAFISNFDYLQQLGRQAIHYLKKWRTTQLEQQAQTQRTVICHGAIHRQHVIHDGERLYFINFDHANVDHPARDLALFFRRHIDPSMEWDVNIGLEWLKAYEDMFPLKMEERLLFGIYLLFPERVFREIEAYYEAKKDIHPMTWARQVEKLIDLTRTIRLFVREMIENHGKELNPVNQQNGDHDENDDE